MSKLLNVFMLLVTFMGVSIAQTVVTVADADLEAGGTYNWTNDKVYHLDGFVFLEAGGTLNIEAGTVIKGLEIPSSNDLASTLIIAKGATINAVGTKEEPIIFTAEIDDETDPSDMAVDDRGLWGGLIILGNATITNDGQVEEAVEGLPADDPRSLYGGDDDADNSGVLKYVSIRHGGAELAPGEEINGLTLGGVGSNTSIDYVEVIANSDDGIEWFGGTVSVSHASVAFCGDDSYDYDIGWRGGGQFWFSLQAADEGDNAGEHDGAKPDAATPSSNPSIFNATFIGSGVDGTAKNEHALYFRDGSRGTYGNSIFTDFANYAIQVEDRASGVDSRQYMEAGELNIVNNIWWNFGEGTELNAGTNGIIQATGDAEDPTAKFLVDHLVANGNTIKNPGLGGISRTDDGGLDPRPSDVVTSGLAKEPEGDFYTTTEFKGAFCTEGVWIAEWTALAEYGILSPDIPYAEENCETVSVKELASAAKGFVLEQNAPNPSINTTNIAFTLPTATNVSLVIYDMNGKIVKQLLNNEKFAAGQHSVDLDASSLANGTYVYSLFNANVTLGSVMIVKK